MARRRDKRELFEIFKEAKAAPHEPPRPGRPLVSRETGSEGGTSALHTIRLGDRRQIELFLSLGWVYGILCFLFLALVAAFILGRKSAPPAPEAAMIDAPGELVEEVSRVGSVAGTPAGVAAEGEGIGEAAGETPGAGVAADEADMQPVPTVQQGTYTLRVATYKPNEREKEMAQDFLEFLKSKGEDARLVTSRRGDWIYLTIGSFETMRSDEAKDLEARVKRLNYKNHDFSKVFFQDVRQL